MESSIYDAFFVTIQNQAFSSEILGVELGYE